MRLFRVLQTGVGVQSLSVSGSGSPPAATQFFEVTDGPLLLTIDSIEDMGNGALTFSNGPATIRPERDARIETLLKAHD